jgi:hypothetical protein
MGHSPGFCTQEVEQLFAFTTFSRHYRDHRSSSSLYTIEDSLSGVATSITARHSSNKYQLGKTARTQPHNLAKIGDNGLFGRAPEIDEEQQAEAVANSRISNFFA